MILAAAASASRKNKNMHIREDAEVNAFKFLFFRSEEL